MWTTPIFDRTSEDVAYAQNNRSNPLPLKGALNYSDWQRIADNIYYLANELTTEGFPITPICSKNWSRDTLAYRSDIEKIKIDVAAIRKIISIFPGIPQTPELPYTAYQKINDIEKILYEGMRSLQAITSSIRYSDTLYSGGLF